MLPLVIAFPLLLAIAAHEWPAPGAGLSHAGRFAVGVALPLGTLAVGWFARRTNWPGRRLGYPMLGWIAGSLTLTLGWGWSQWVSNYLGQQGVMAAAVILVPHLGSLIVIWAVPFWGSARGQAVVGKTWSGRPWRAVGREVLVRCQWSLLPILLPLFVVLATRDCLEANPEWAAANWTSQVMVLSLTSMLVVMVVFPHVLGWSLQTSPVQGRPRCEALAIWTRRMGFSPVEIAVWETKWRVANALVVGWLPRLRRILISDVLCGTLRAPELVAVLLHETGHVRRHHLWWRLAVVLLGCCLLILVAAEPWSLEADPQRHFVQVNWMAILNFGCLLMLTTFLMGFMSRALEFEADDFALEQIERYGAAAPASIANSLSHRDGSASDGQLTATCGPGDLISAIQKTARMNRVDSRRVTWMHPSVEQRIERLEWSQQSPACRLLARQRLRFLKGVLAVALLVLFAVIWLHRQ